MSGNATSRHSRNEVRQRPPQRCDRCAKRIADGKGRLIPGVGILCTRCAERGQS